MRAGPDEPTRPDLPVHRQTRPGIGPEPLPPPPPPPPRSITPESGIQVELGGSRLSVKKRHIQGLWLFVAPVVITGATSVLGYLKGYAKGLADAAERLAKIEAKATNEATKRAALEQRMDSVEAELAKEETSTRQERATAITRWQTLSGDVESLKKGLPQIQGLPLKR